MRLRPERHPDPETLSAGLRRARAGPRYRALAAPWLLGLCASLLGASSLAATRELNVAGVLHTVQVEVRTGGASVSGTKLVHYVQTPELAVESRIVAGTDEPGIECDPSLSLSPLSGYPVLVWSRQDGADLEIFVSIYDGVRWATPWPLTANTVDDRKPQVFWGASNLIHVTWTATSAEGASTVYEAILDGKGATVRAPALVNLSPAVTVTPVAGGSPTFDADEVLFAFDANGKVERRVITYGGYDEPIPILHRADFVLPWDAGNIGWARASRVKDTFVFMTRAGTKVWYSIQTRQGWAPLRAVNLDAMVTEEAAVLLIQRMAERTTP